MGSTAKNRTLQAMVRRQLAEAGISEKAKNTELAAAFGRVCANILFTNMVQKDTRYPDGANDHGIDVYRIFDNGAIAIVQCKYDNNHDPNVALGEIRKTAEFIRKMCEAYDADAGYDPHTALKMPSSQDALFDAVITQYMRGGIKGVCEKISYYFCMASPATSDCCCVEKTAKTISGFSNVRVLAGEELVRLYDEHMLDLDGVPEGDLGIKKSTLALARALYAEANEGRGGHETLEIPLTGQNIAVAVGCEFSAQYNFTRLFSSNVRGFLQNKELNEQIDDTIVNKPSHFIDYNLGITIVCSGTEIRPSHGNTDDDVILKNWMILNGGQTTANIYNEYKQGIDVSKVRVSCKLIIEPDKNERKKIAICLNTQKPITATDIRSTDEKAMLLQAHLKDENFYLGLKRGSDLPKTVDKYRKCNDFKSYVQFMTAFAVHQPYIARNCGSSILLSDRWFNYILYGDYALDNSPATYAASVMVLSNYLKEAISDFNAEASDRDTTGLIYAALNTLGIQTEMLHRSAGARNDTFESLIYDQPPVRTRKGFNDVDLSKPFAQYDMVVNHEQSNTAIDLLRPFINWLYKKVEAESAAAELPLSQGLRSQTVFQRVASDLCAELSQYTYNTCEKKYPYLRLLKPYSD